MNEICTTAAATTTTTTTTAAAAASSSFLYWAHRSYQSLYIFTEILKTRRGGVRLNKFVKINQKYIKSEQNPPKSRPVLKGLFLI